MSEIEKISAFNSVRAYLNEGDQASLLSKLGLDDETLKIRLAGLKAQDELCLILRYLNACQHILAFDEGISVLTGSYQPDLLVKSKANQTFFVEIKNVPGSVFKISGGNLRRRIQFAEEFGFPLFFSIKLGAYWTLYPSDFVQRQSGKVSFNDFKLSQFNNMFDSQFYLFPAGIEIECVYSSSAQAIGSGIKHGEYGNLISYKLTFNDKTILEANEAQSEDALLAIVLENLQDAMSVQSQNVSRLENGDVVVVESLTHNLLTCDYQFMLATARHVLTDLGYFHDSTTFLKKFLEDREELIKKEHLNMVVQELIAKGIPIEVSDNPEYRVINPGT